MAADLESIEMATFPGRLYDKGREHLQSGVFISLSPNGIAPVVQLWVLEPGAHFGDIAREVISVAYEILTEGGGILLTCPDPETISEIRFAILTGLDAVTGDRTQWARA